MTRKDASRLDFALTLKLSHQDEVAAFRYVSVQNVIDSYFSRAIPTYNVNNSVESVRFYLDKTRQQSKIQFVGDTAGSLNNKYFLINTGGNRKKYYVWYNNGTGSDPLVAGRIGIEVEYNNNESASTIANRTAMALLLTAEFDDGRDTLGQSSLITITSVDKGLSDLATAGITPFTVTTLHEGETEFLKEYEVVQIPGIRIVYNEFQKTFEFISIGDDVVATGFFVNNYTLATAGTEYAIALPDGTKKFRLQSAEPAVKLAISDTSGGDIFYIRYGAYYQEDHINSDNVTFYITATKDNTVVQLLSWT